MGIPSIAAVLACLSWSGIVPCWLYLILLCRCLPMTVPFSQTERLGRLTTDLGPDTLALLRFDGTDHLNDLFRIPRRGAGHPR